MKAKARNATPYLLRQGEQVDPKATYDLVEFDFTPIYSEVAVLEEDGSVTVTISRYSNRRRQRRRRAKEHKQ